MFLPTLIILLAFLNINYPAGSEYDAELLEQNTICKVHNKRLTTERSYRIRINNKGGEYYSGINIHFRKKEPVSIEEAWIVNKSGQIIRKLTNKEIILKSDISANALYEDSYVISFTLRHAEYPYEIFYKYKQTSDDFFRITGWSPVHYQGIPTRKANLIVEIPLNYKIHILEKKISGFRSDTIGENRILRWTSSFSEPGGHEIFTPHYFDSYPFVSVVPVDFSYSVPGSFRDWNSYGNWVSSLFEGTQDLSKQEIEMVKRLTSNCQNDYEKTRILYHYLQDNTRYINVSIDVGGWKPFPASYVSTKKYGDCKALSNYMCSLLKAAGIKSYYSIVYAGEKNPETDISEMNHPVNHAFVYVDLPDDSLWLECTSNISPFGYLGTFTQNRYAFIIEKDNSRFIKTPAMNIYEVKNSRNFVFTINNTNKTSGRLHLRLRGRDYEDFIEVKTYLRKEDQEKFLYDKLGFNDFLIRKWEIKTPDRDSAYIDLEADLEILNYIKSYGNMMIINPMTLPIPEFETPEKRKLDIMIPYPMYYADTTEYIIQGNITSVSVPSDTLIKSKYGIFQQTATISSGGHIMINKSFCLFSSRYVKYEYPFFYDFINSIKNADKKVITLKK